MFISPPKPFWLLLISGSGISTFVSGLGGFFPPLFFLTIYGFFHSLVAAVSAGLLSSTTGALAAGISLGSGSIITAGELQSRFYIWLQGS